MTRRILAVVLIAVIATVSVTAFAQGKRTERQEQARDPVCGLMVDKNPALAANYKGETYYFCSKADMEKFKKEPQKYVKK
ncbi:MAG TPA: YHS domain-containing protein [Terriglobia bacterium]|nr:YHS domain-containing protein [Terriglobia bacterium]